MDNIRTLPKNIIELSEHGNRAPACNLDNVLRVLESEPEFKDLVHFDTFHQKLFTQKSGARQEWADEDTLELTVDLQRRFHLSRLSDETVFKALRTLGNRTQKDELREWMESLEWDGQERIDHSFVKHAGAKDSEYTRAVGSNFWKSMAVRALIPGSKVDTMPVFQGPQGAGKSTFLKVIGGDWYTEAHESVTSKDFLILLQGKLLIEISELDAFGKAESSTIKRVITSATDRFRALYAHCAKDHPRRCVFAGTTNTDDYLKDMTGARRFWPVQVGKIDLKGLEQNRSQLFAEAAHRVAKKEPWWLTPTAATHIEQEARRQRHPWEDLIEDFLDCRSSITVEEILIDLLKIDLSHLGSSEGKRKQMDVAKILKKLDFEKQPRARLNGKLQTLWTRCDSAK